MSDPLIGLQFDEYRLDAFLGKGGMARIYRATDVQLDREVAIKIIDTPLRQAPDIVERFQREARAIARLEHPHIVGLYRFGEAHGHLYMAMQYVRGTTLDFILDTYREDQRYMSPGDVIRLTREVCLALDYAHEHGIIHRDVKPSNIMLNAQGTVLLADFGLALIAEIGTLGQAGGSPHYIAPEQAISSSKAVPQSDLYALGVTVFEMLTNHLPFTGDVPLDVAMMHLTDAPPSPRAFRPELPEGVEAVVLRMLEKDPASRYPDGASLAAALADALK